MPDGGGVAGGAVPIGIAPGVEINVMISSTFSHRTLAVSSMLRPPAWASSIMPCSAGMLLLKTPTPNKIARYCTTYNTTRTRREGNEDSYTKCRSLASSCSPVRPDR